jgi:hypothetical protein
MKKVTILVFLLSISVLAWCNTNNNWTTTAKEEWAVNNTSIMSWKNIKNELNDDKDLTDDEKEALNILNDILSE